MSGKMGVKRYPETMKEMVRKEREQGASLKGLSKKYGVSKYTVQSWCGLRPEVELRHAAPRPKGRPRKNPESQEQLIRRLQMENELLRNFLSVVGRK